MSCKGCKFDGTPCEECYDGDKYAPTPSMIKAKYSEEVRELIAMQLHETIVVNGSTTVMRVPNGWLYQYYSHHRIDQHGAGDSIYHPPVFVAREL